MKNRGLFLNLIVAGAVSILAGCSGSSGGAGPTTREDIINLTWDPVLPSVEATYTAYASADITIGGTSVVSSTFTLTKAEITRLQYKADSLGAGMTGNFVTGIEFQYGIDTNHGSNSFDLYVRPLYFTCSTPPAPGSVYTYTATPSSLDTTNSFYLLSPTGTMSKDVSNQNMVDAGNYRREVRISHYYGDTFTHYIPGQDIKSVVYPFQEIDTLMKANSDSTVILLSVGFPIISGTYPFIRHSLLLEPTGCPAGTAICSLFPQNCCADLTNPCPTNCANTGVVYTITTKY